MNINLSYKKERILNHISLAFSSTTLIFVFIISSILSALFLVILMAPELFIRLLLDGFVIFYFEQTVSVIQAESGSIGLFLTILYAICLGLLFTSVYNRLISLHSLSASNLLPAVPSILIGCGSCGFGILALLGFTSFATLIEGNTIRILGIILIIISLGFIESPENSSCELRHG